MPSRIQVRRDTAANWTSANPVLALGEIGYEIDFIKCKFGDGVSGWTELPYAVDVPFTSDAKEKLAGIETGAQVNVVTSVHGRTGAVNAQAGDYTAEQITETATKVVMTAGERSKLSGIEAKAQVNPTRITTAEKTTGTATTVRGFAPVDVRDMVVALAPAAPVSSVAGRTGAVTLQSSDVGLGNVSNVAQVRADLTYIAKTAPAAGDKLLIKDQTDAQPKLVDWASLPANPPRVATAEKVAGTLTDVRGFSPSDVKDMVVTHAPPTSFNGRSGAITPQAGDYTAEQITETTVKVVMTADERTKLGGIEAKAQVNTVASVFGRTGVVAAQTGDYTAEQITETTTRVVMTADERTKLGGVEAKAQVNPSRITTAEKTAATATTIRGFAPVDVRDMVVALAPAAPVSSVAGRTGAVTLQSSDVGLGNVSNVAQVRADLTYTAKTTPAAGDKLLIKDQADGLPKLVDWTSLPAGPARVASAEKTAGVLTDLRGFSPSDVKDMVVTHAPATSFNGRTGTIVPQANDYNAEQISETAKKVVMTSDERTKLAGVEAGASSEQELTEITTAYSELNTKLTKAKAGVKAVVINAAHKQCVVKNAGADPVVVVAPEGIVASGTVMNDSTSIDFPLATHGLPSSFQKFVCSFYASVDQPPTDGTDHANYILSSFLPSAGAFELAVLGVSPAPKVFQVFGRSAAGTVIVDQRSVDLPSISFTFGVLHHFLIACDLTVPIVQLFIDGQLISWRSGGYTPVLQQNGTFGMSSTNLRVGGRSSTNSVNLRGHVEQLFLAFDSYLDISVPTNLQKFWKDGAINLGFNGWRPLGKPPALFLNGAGADFSLNKARATNDAGTVNGTLVAPTLLPTGTSPAKTVEGTTAGYVLGAGLKQQFVRIAGTGQYEVL